MTKFIIRSVFQDYDSFDFKEVCITDTKELAVEIVEELELLKQELLEFTGVVISTEDINEDLLEALTMDYFQEIRNVYKKEATYKIFVSDEVLKYIEVDSYLQKTNMFQFISGSEGKVCIDLIYRICNNENAKLIYEELKYITNLKKDKQ